MSVKSGIPSPTCGRFGRKQNPFPRALFRQLVRLCQAAVVEFQHPQPGSELQLRALLMQMLVALLRWAKPRAPTGEPPPPVTAWAATDRALQFLRQNYTEPIYARQVAAAAGLSESRLRTLFHQTLGMPWVRYLQHYRVHQAATLLAEPANNVTESALAVGFEDLAHFISVFRATMGVTPSQYIKNIANSRPKKTTTSGK
jgi:AraC-like DNA-binding protein